MKECYGQPTCVVDTQLFEHVCAHQTTGVKILEMPNSMDFDQYSLHSTFDSDNSVAVYAGWMLVCVLSAMCDVVCCVLCDDVCCVLCYVMCDV
jgi:hypothetical protein